MITDKLEKGDKLYYPSLKGIALLCEVVDTSEKDVLVSIEDKHYYLPKESVNLHGIVIDEAKARAYVTQRIEDPDHSLVYYRYMWNETAIDKLYNRYCDLKGRITKPHVISAKPKVLPQIDHPSRL